MHDSHLNWDPFSGLSIASSSIAVQHRTLNKLARTGKNVGTSRIYFKVSGKPYVQLARVPAVANPVNENAANLKKP